MDAAAIAVAGSNSDLIRDCSFEITAKDLAQLDAMLPLVPPGTVVSITYLQNEGDAARIDAARTVRASGLTPMPHLAARRLPSHAALHHMLDVLVREAAVDRLFVVAGDLSVPDGPFPDAQAVLAELPAEGHGLRTIGIAGYPDGHPRIGGAGLDAARREKIALLAARGLAIEIMTQFAFDADPIVQWLARVRSEGFTGRVRLGLPGPAHVGTLLRYAGRCGVGASAKVMAKYGASITRLLHTAGPDRLYDDLSRAIAAGSGPVGIHLYPFGGLLRTAQWAHAKRGAGEEVLP